MSVGYIQQRLFLPFPSVLLAKLIDNHGLIFNHSILAIYLPVLISHQEIKRKNKSLTLFNEWRPHSLHSAKFIVTAQRENTLFCSLGKKGEATYIAWSDNGVSQQQHPSLGTRGIFVLSNHSRQNVHRYSHNSSWGFPFCFINCITCCCPCASLPQASSFQQAEGIFIRRSYLFDQLFSFRGSLRDVTLQYLSSNASSLSRDGQCLMGCHFFLMLEMGEKPRDGAMAKKLREPYQAQGKVVYFSLRF